MKWPFDSPVHVAGVIDAQEAEMLIGCGVRYLGFPLVLGYHKEDLSADAAAGIVADLGDRATFFLITYLSTADDIVALSEHLDVDMVQLHGDVTAVELVRLRRARPDFRIIKSLIVGGGNDDRLTAEMANCAAHVDAFITDTFDPATGATGATGLAHDWDISARLALASPKPVVLAGGLNAHNVGDAIAKVRPVGVDVHTGVEADSGRKCPDRVRAFLAAAHTSLAALRD